jgi:hypothetical protein
VARPGATMRSEIESTVMARLGNEQNADFTIQVWAREYWSIGKYENRIFPSFNPLLQYSTSSLRGHIHRFEDLVVTGTAAKVSL